MVFFSELSNGLDLQVTCCNIIHNITLKIPLQSISIPKTKEVSELLYYCICILGYTFFFPKVSLKYTVTPKTNEGEFFQGLIFLDLLETIKN